jgi:NitT/TauT family transport system substrate-binding protein
MRHQIKSTVLVIVLWAAIIGPGAVYSAEAPQRLRIAYPSRSTSAMPQYMAQRKGFFKAEGLDVELIQVNPRLHASALVSGDVAIGSAFTSVFRGALQGFPIKLVMVNLKKSPYFLLTRPDIKSVEQLKGKKLGVATVLGSDHLVAEELFQAKGFNPAWVQAVGIGDAQLRMQALLTGVVEVICVATPHDLLLQKMGYNAIAGPPEVGLPGMGMFASDRVLKENPQAIKKALKAMLRAHQYMFDNRQETLQVITQWLALPADVAAHSFDQEVKPLLKDGVISDADVEVLIARLGDKKRAVDEVRDFTLVREAAKELNAGK